MGKDTDSKNILIIKPGAIGDLLQLTPVIRALATRYPGSRISILVGTRATATLFKCNPYVAETLVFDRRGEHGSLSSLLKLWQHMRRMKYNLVINFQRSNLKTWLLATAALPCRALIYHKTRNQSVHVVDNYLDTLTPLGIFGQNRNLELAVGDEDERFAEALFSSNKYGGELVIALNPGASHPVNHWGADRFAALADALVKGLSAKVIIIGGPEDIVLAKEISSATASRPLVLCGNTTLLQLGAVLKRCSLLISGDTGPLHLATAVGTRVVALFGAADPARTGPVGTGHRVLQAHGVACRPCRRRVCTSGIDLECMKKISTQEVLDAVREMLNPERTEIV